MTQTSPEPGARAHRVPGLRATARGLVRTHRRFATGLARATAGTLRRDPGAAGVEPAAGDKRFDDPAWDTNPYFHLVRQTYLLGSRFVLESVDALPLGEHDRVAARFLAELGVGAAAPTNFLPGNPAALRAARQTRGRSLVQGTANFLSDLAANRGLPAAVDAAPFVKGRDLAATPGKVVFRNEVMELIQYEPRTETVHAVPMLVSPPWVNKYYVLDLAPQRSVIGWLVEHGHTVFAISYRNPDAASRDVGLDHYVRDGLVPALGAIADITGAEEVNLAGACLGGLLALMLAAWVAEDERPRIGCITLINTIADFTDSADFADNSATGKVLRRFVVPAIARAADRRGYIDGRDMDAFFRFLRADDLVWRYVGANWLRGGKPPAFDILAWNSDPMNVTPRAQDFFMRQSCLDNDFAGGRVELAGRRLRPERVEQDVFVTSARDDHIIPWEFAYRTTSLLPGDVRFHLVSGGHIAGAIAPPHPRARYWASDRPPAPDPATWLAGATEHKDTWWHPWVEWLRERSGPQRTPPPIGSARYPAGEPAPGVYIHSRGVPQGPPRPAGGSR
ncbi:alpha/beta fold hydrolase [Actinokineospora sp. PR83]|uniref:PHA/PHB synthase family protein n=1 Tax=Actinokineospora sp. PR83 TaxID=2884908 RepID=UPI0027E0CF8E|nr:alpha/beta fold hydrolase [Actinokineospora sp. PR83]MCG8914519.1 alpha/beta fold hydrolase [Actinokineospora sp. PR83]